ncbi:hypothetical protein Ah1_00077 [Aeromonas phage Ah1]|uniref:Uncharacterized protein n=1 Tax=Aeromonas phage Ah1 TaxID=2053701 RepID=A0A2H4YEL3_9CAUD|nr:hypothetical protein KNT77_gp077 [Aeromonas phage Ah1]AUE22618.1 hypothetical protein Ah1_00077 [Aeromonas phage Ah1]
MHFDYMIANPPYSAGLHVDFVNLGVKKCDVTIAVHPSGPFINRKPTRQTKRVAELLDNMKTYTTSVHLFDGNAVFKAGFLTPLSITVIDKTMKAGLINVSGYYDARLPINRLNMIGDWCVKLYDRFPIQSVAHHACSGEVSDASHYVTIASVRGHPPEAGKRFNSDFFTMFPVDYIPTTEMPKRGTNFAFKTLEEAENFIAYLKTDFARFMLSLYKMNVHLDSGELHAIPWVDMTKRWTDDELFEKFDMLDIKSRVPEVIEDYYGGKRHKTQVVGDTRMFTDKIDRDRQKKTAEFFTPIELVNQMLDHTDIDDPDSSSTFFEPSCGDGNILEGIVKRMLEAGQNAGTIVSRIYACEYMLDNRNAAIERLVKILGEEYRTQIENQIAYCNTLDETDTSDGRKYPDWLKDTMWTLDV